MSLGYVTSIINYRKYFQTIILLSTQVMGMYQLNTIVTYLEYYSNSLSIHLVTSNFKGLNKTYTLTSSSLESEMNKNILKWPILTSHTVTTSQLCGLLSSCFVCSEVSRALRKMICRPKKRLQIGILRPI